jgi:hypothetical protein
LKPGLADLELESGRVEEKIKEEKIQCDLVDPTTRLQPVDFFFFFY